ncbi:MAG TPA: glycerophosphodiester phosphodiesterase family protein [Candidatus Cybelea sp.]|nr:glycerophosphodiester phosphodiesterase family protein [Candidatus Cybelea sp.]
MLQIQLFASDKAGPFISAHRGYSAAAPENTLPALEAALTAGAHVAEIDIKITKDGHLVLMHDSEVDRTTDGEGRVADMTLAEISRLDAGRWFDRKFARTRVPTLDEVLAWSKGRLGILIEMKDFPERDPRFLSTLIETVERNDASGFAIPAGFDHKTTAALHKMRPDWTLEMIMQCRLADTVHAARAAGCTLISLEPEFAVAEDIPTMHEAGLSVLTTVKSIAHAKELYEMGVDFIEADDVDLARAGLAACGRA